MPVSYLFVPADSARKIEKAFASSAHAILCDLEDGVALSQKNAARQTLIETINSLRAQQLINKPFYVRINSAKSTFINNDLALINNINPNGIMLPKCENISEIENINSTFPELEIIPLIESVAGVYFLSQIDKMPGCVKKIAFGAVDYALDLGTDWTASGEERHYAMGQLVFASRRLNLESPIDAVFPVIKDESTFERDVQTGKNYGFCGKMIIHPAQINAVHRAYQISEEQLNWHRAVVDEYENKTNSGAFELEGKLIDYPVYLKSKKVLQHHAPIQEK